jgi:Domain of unknown function (DUF5664)
MTNSKFLYSGRCSEHAEWSSTENGCPECGLNKKKERRMVMQDGLIKDVNITKSKNQDAKQDNNKPPMELLSPIAMEATARVLGFGARKYSANGWRKVDLHWTRILAAILRHTFAILRGEDLDPESGLPHIDHVATEAMFLQELYRTRKDLDDRYKS